MAKKFMLGDRSTYSAGGTFIPEGDYALEFNIQLWQDKKADGTPIREPFLAMVVNFYPLDGGEMATQRYGMGTKASLSFLPDPDTGKGLVEVPGGPGAALSDKTNWSLFHKSLEDSGLPIGILENDMTVIDGIWCHIQNIPEPEERKNFGKSQTSEAAGEERKGGGMIPVVTEIKEDGKPWEGSGGIPEQGKPKVAAKKAPVKAAVKAAPVAVAKKVNGKPAPAIKDEGEDTLTAAQNAIAEVLESKPDGLPKILLRTTVFKSLGGKDSQTAQSVMDQFFASDESLADILGQVGYTLDGNKVVPA